MPSDIRQCEIFHLLKSFSEYHCILGANKVKKGFCKKKIKRKHKEQQQTHKARSFHWQTKKQCF